MLLDLSFAGGVESRLLQVVLKAANDLGMAMLNVLAERLHAPHMYQLIPKALLTGTASAGWLADTVQDVGNPVGNPAYRWIGARTANCPRKFDFLSCSLTGRRSFAGV